MSYNLYLDDFRDPIDSAYYLGINVYGNLDWIVVRNYDDFVDYIKKHGIPEIVSFDHDLADEHYGTHQNLDEIEYLLYEEKTGYHCAKWLINYCVDNNLELPTEVLIHSMNPAGSANIKSLFDTYNKYKRI
jgi:hypothetical protein